LPLFFVRIALFAVAMHCCLLPAQGQQLQPVEIPVIQDGLSAELASLQAQIDELRAAAAKPKPETASDSAKPNKLSPHGKPTLELGGQMQADTVYFSQDPESMAAVGDLQDGSQFRRLRLVARG